MSWPRAKKRRSSRFATCMELPLDRPIPPVSRPAGHHARHQRPAHAARRTSRPSSPPADSPTCCGSAIRIGRGCSIWRSQAGAVVCRSRRDRRTDRRRRRRAHPPLDRRRRRAAIGATASSTASSRWPSACCTPIAIPRTRNSSNGSPARSASRRSAARAGSSPLIKIVSRGDTTVVDAYLNPILRHYVDRLRRVARRACSACKLLTSAGGLVDADRFVGKDSILSGPAGGVVGFRAWLERAGFEQAIGFDMGGTSTDVSRFDGRYETGIRDREGRRARRAPRCWPSKRWPPAAGSICHFDGVKLVGRARQRRGRSRAGLLRPRRSADRHRRQPVSRQESPDRSFRFRSIARPSRAATGSIVRTDRRLSRPGANTPPRTGGRFRARWPTPTWPRRFAASRSPKATTRATTCWSRSAAPARQHACAVARELGIDANPHPSDAGMLSAYGIGMADVRDTAKPASSDSQSPIRSPNWKRHSRTSNRQPSRRSRQKGFAQGRIELPLRFLDLRYHGVEATLTIAQPADGDYRAAYEPLHEQTLRLPRNERPLEIVAARVEVIGRDVADNASEQPTTYASARSRCDAQASSSTAKCV